MYTLSAVSDQIMLGDSEIILAIGWREGVDRSALA
jgi:hypothetical protein